MRFSTVTSLIALMAASAAAPLAAQTASAPAPAAASADKPITAAGGTATVLVPAGWVQSDKGGATVLTAPEGDLVLALVPVTGAANGEAAVKQAWQAFMPSFARPIRLQQAMPGRDGWESGHVVSYDIAPAEKHVSQGVALKHGAGYTVVLVDGALATIAKRGGQLGQFNSSLRPAGYVKESFAGRPAHTLDAARIRQLVDFARDSMAQLNIPGVGLALIDDGKIVWEGGLGVKDVASKAPVDKDTLFMIASNTKGMATLLLSTLVDEGKLDWEKPVTDYMPTFRLGSPETTKKVLVKHLVCACTGLPRKDLQWLFNTSPQTAASDTFVQLAATEPTSGFGEVFQYNNLMASAAGYLGAHILHPDMELGAAYDRAMDERIFTPLGMTRTTHSAAEAMKANWAKPYDTTIRGEIGAVDPRNNDTVVPYRPAGGAWSSAHDMALYVQNELSEGLVAGGKRLVSADALLARRAHNVPVGENMWYGMGLFEDQRTGVTVVEHGGSLFGYKSNWFAIPSAGVGAVVLTNSDVGHLLTAAVKRRLLEVLYDGKPEAAENVASSIKQSEEARKKVLGEMIWSIPAELQQTVIGRYTNAELGPLTIARENGKLVAHATALRGELAGRKNPDGTMSLYFVEPGFWGDGVLVGQRDGKTALIMNDTQHEYVWLKQ